MCCRSVSRFLSRIALLWLALMLAACAGPTSRVSSGLAVESASDGWIVGSIGAENAPPLVAKGSGFNDHRLFFVSRGGEGGVLAFDKGEVFGMDKDINSGGIAANVFVQRLPAGIYAFVGAEFWANYGMYGTATGRGKLARPVPFVVRPGQVTYIGSFIGSTEWRRNLLGREPVAGYFIVTDASTRDLPLIERKFSGLPKPIVVQLVDPGESNRPLLKHGLPVLKD